MNAIKRMKQAIEAERKKAGQPPRPQICCASAVFGVHTRNCKKKVQRAK